jgi:uncharacterized protein (TIGR03382 family)
VQSGTTAHYTFTLRNTTATDWSDATEIAIAGGTASQLYDATSWTSPSVIGTLPSAVPAGTDIDVDFDVVAPAVQQETPIAQPIILSDSGMQVAAFNLGLTVTMGSDNTPSEGTNEPNPPSPTVSGGCAAGGSGAGGLALVLLVVPAVVIRRRRR